MYKTIHLIVSGQHGEGVPVSLLQAMSMRVPAIGSSVSGIRELLKKNIGILFNNNVEDLAKKRKKNTSNQRNYVISNYNYLNMFDKYYFIINNICKI